MALTAEREGRMAEWSDGRLDEFALRVDERFDRAEEKTDERFDRVEQRANDRFSEVDRCFEEVGRRFDHGDREFARINDRLDDLAKVMIGGILTLTGAILAGFAALVVLFSTQF
jgi:hypothetical protein